MEKIIQAYILSSLALDIVCPLVYFMLVLCLENKCIQMYSDALNEEPWKPSLNFKVTEQVNGIASPKTKVSSRFQSVYGRLKNLNELYCGVIYYTLFGTSVWSAILSSSFRLS